MKSYTPILIPDTNYLMDFPDLLKEKWLLSPLIILICETVETELRGLRFNADPIRSEQAKRALELLTSFRRLPFSLDENLLDTEIRFVVRYSDPMPPLDPSVPDHQIIGLAKKLSQNRFCAILTNDRDMSDIANVLTVYNIARMDVNRFHHDIQLMYAWWKSSHNAPPVEEEKKETAAVEKEIKLSTKGRRLPRPYQHSSDPIDQYVSRLYRQMGALKLRTSIFLPIMLARIRLALEVIRRVREPEKEVILVVVKDEETERFWAGEIRQRGGYSTTEVVTFGSRESDRLDQARLILYQHHQIVLHLPQHITRLGQFHKRITALVDGCDLLDPVELAILLYECDHFIGLSHLPWNDQQARGRKMLNVLLRNRALPDVSFVDAERDGWGLPCDFALHQVEFEPDEREEWDRMSADFMRFHDRIRSQNPSLGNIEDFWEGISQRLNRIADPESAEMLKLREQREQMAQLAHQKLELVKDLFANDFIPPHRQIIFDFNRSWTPVLLRELAACGLKPVELPADRNDQRSVWDQFSAKKFDTLLVSCTPSIDLPVASYHRLAILTPLQPMDELIAIIDWAMMHAAKPEPLRTDLFYVVNTPEELAMMTLAKAGFGWK